MTEPVDDFSIPPCEDLRECPWWRPIDVAFLDDPGVVDPVVRKFVPELLEAFREQGHRVHLDSDGAVDLLLGLVSIPDGPEPLRQRIPERPRPYALTLMRQYGFRKRPENLVVLVGVPERLSGRPHEEVVETARTAMARIGTPKVVFVSGTDVLEEVTFCTMEGGHPTDHRDPARRLRDRLVSAACAREVGGDYEVVPSALPRSVWEATRVPDALVAAGKRMDSLGLLPPPKQIAEYVSADLARMYRRFLGLKGFSEGMLFAVDPESGTTMVTASGSWDVDKRALRREEVVPLGGVEGQRVRVLAPEGVKPKGPSVEAWEVLSLLEAVPRVRVSKSSEGTWRLDPEGPVEVPLVRAGVHVHVGVTAVDASVVESLPANRQLFPFGFGCGTDLMCEVVRDVARRSRALRDPTDRRAFVRWPMLYHGDTVVELWKPSVPDTPLEGLLDLFDPKRRGAIRYRPDHLEQPA